MYNLETFEQKANSLTTDKIKVLTFNGVKSPVEFTCLQCGRTQKVARGEVLLRKNKKFQCQFCHYSKEEQTKETLHKIQYLCNSKKITLLKFTKVGEVATFKCDICKKEFTREPNRFLKNPTCPSCERTGTMSFEKFMEELNKRYELDEYVLVEPEKYNKTHDKMLVRHKCGFVWKISPSDLLLHQCPQCARKTSKGEKAIKNFCDMHSIEYIWQWQQKINERMLYFDFYLPKYNLAIEFQGEQHYKPIKYWGGEEGFQRRLVNDNDKREWCKKQNIHLLEISFTSFEKINEILESSTTSRET